MISFSHRTSRATFIIVAAAALAPAARADIAVEIAFGAPDNIFPNGGTTHGWQFSVNLPIEVTHVGLYDRFQDGFALAHPVGLWDGTGSLLAEETIGPGAGDLLIGNFRYVPVGGITEGPGDSLILIPGVTYTIGFFTSVFLQSDGMVIFDGFHTVNAVIDYVGFGVSDFTEGLQMPIDPDPGFHRWGPNFQFTIVPAPAMTPLLCLLLVGRRRRRRAGSAAARRS